MRGERRLRPLRRVAGNIRGSLATQNPRETRAEFRTREVPVDSVQHGGVCVPKRPRNVIEGQARCQVPSCGERKESPFAAGDAKTSATTDVTPSARRAEDLLDIDVTRPAFGGVLGCHDVGVTTGTRWSRNRSQRAGVMSVFPGLWSTSHVLRAKPTWASFPSDNPMELTPAQTDAPDSSDRGDLGGACAVPLNRGAARTAAPRARRRG